MQEFTSPFFQSIGPFRMTYTVRFEGTLSRRSLDLSRCLAFDLIGNL